MAGAPGPTGRKAEGLTGSRLLWVRRVAVLSVAMTFMLMVLGAWVKANGAGLACPDWPACYGQLLPPFPSVENAGRWTHTVDGQTVTDPVVFTQAQELYEWAHRAVVGLLVVPLLTWTILTVRKGATPLHPALRALPATALGLYVFQAFLGAVTVKVGNAAWATTAHLATAVLFFGTQLVALMFAFLRPQAVPAPAESRPRPGLRQGPRDDEPVVLRSGAGSPGGTGRGFVWGGDGRSAGAPGDAEHESEATHG
jgi:heme A synthase